MEMVETCNSIGSRGAASAGRLGPFAQESFQQNRTDERHRESGGGEVGDGGDAAREWERGCGDQSGRD